AGLARGGLRLGLKKGLAEGTEAGVRREARSAVTQNPHAVARAHKEKVCVDDRSTSRPDEWSCRKPISLPGSLPLLFTRTFESSYRAGRWFGVSWASTLDQRLEIDAEGVVFIDADGSILAYPHPAPNVPVLPGHGRRWPLDRTLDGYTVTDPESGHVRRFSLDGRLVQVDDRNGAWIVYDYDGDGVPTGIRHSGGYELRIDTEEGRVIRLSLGDGTRILDYRYDEGQPHRSHQLLR
nr:DUF6531 domain-containing protein [Streptomyces tricolor]